MFDYDQQKYEEFIITSDTTKVVKPTEAFFIFSKKGNCRLDLNDDDDNSKVSYTHIKIDDKK